MSYRHNLLPFFFLFFSGGVQQGNMAIYLREHWKIIIFRAQNQCKGMFENNFKEQGRP